jgi:hypothetical protein
VGSHEHGDEPPDIMKARTFLKDLHNWYSQDGLGCVKFVHNTLESTSYPE